MPAAPATLSAEDLERRIDARGFQRHALLASMGARRREQDALAAQQLLDVTEWADLHRTDVVESFAGEDLLAGHDQHSMPILMSGVPVDEYCLAELSTALGMSQFSCRSLVEESVEGRERLPRLWRRLHAGDLQAWILREVARQTMSLSDEAAEYVDRQLAPFAKRLTKTRIKNLVNTAILQFDPDRAAREAAEASDGRGVWIDDEHGGDQFVMDDSRPNGNGRLSAVLDRPTLYAFNDALNRKAQEQEILGDTSPLQVRRAKAVGILADPQYALDIEATADQVLTEQAEDEGGLEAHSVRTSTTEGRVDRRPSRARSPLGIERPIHIHLHTSTEAARITTAGMPATASPIAKAAVEQWLRDLAPGAKVKVTPVIDLNRNYSVDQHEAPAHLRGQVDERETTCVFPFCTNRGRYDLDHIDEYVDPDDGGPPDQTSNRNLGKLCRFHHRAKTHTRWTYKRVDHPDDLDPHWDHRWIEGDGTTGLDKLDHRQQFDQRIECGPDTGGPPPAYVWISPLGFHYLVTGTGTYPLL